LTSTPLSKTVPRPQIFSDEEDPDLPGSWTPTSSAPPSPQLEMKRQPSFLSETEFELEGESGTFAKLTEESPSQEIAFQKNEVQQEVEDQEEFHEVCSTHK
jgi:hypothetical protein